MNSTYKYLLAILFHWHLFFYNTPILMRTPMKNNKKIMIFVWYIYLLLLFPVFKLFKIRTFNNIGYRIKTHNIDNLLFLFGEIFVSGCYYFQNNRNSPIIIDAGANIGIATLYFKFLYPESIIYSFEPEPKNYLLLKENIINNNLEDVYIERNALVKSNSIVQLNTTKDESTLKTSIYSDRIEEISIKVKGIKLSSYLKKNNITPNVLKMDIEGSEGLVINDLNSEGYLKKISVLCVEYHNNISTKLKLSSFVNILEKNNFINTYSAYPQYFIKNRFTQDILIHSKNLSS